MPHPLSGARIAFDLDGTLVDTAPDLVRALNAAVVPMGLGEVPLDAVRAMVGRGAKAAEAGARLSICTNKPGHLARPLLDQLDLSWRFERVVGPEDAPAKKPDPAHLLTAFGGRPEGFSALVGDSEPDVLAAKAAGASSLIFEGGYSEKPVRDLGADRHFGQFSDLLAALEAERVSR
jgi:phosphoglycolate phosphatase